MPEAPMPHGRTPPGGSPPPRGPLLAYLAALAALAGIPIHLYWAAGGTWGLPGGAAAAGLPGVRATNLAVSVLLACGAAFLYGLTRPWSRRPPALLMLAPVWAGAVMCLSHGLFGMATKSLYAAGVQSAVSWPGHLTAAQKNLAALYDLELARAHCRPCPLRGPCLAGAVERGEPHGVWGGEIFERGVIIARKRPRGRPRLPDRPRVAQLRPRTDRPRAHISGPGAAGPAARPPKQAKDLPGRPGRLPFVLSLSRTTAGISPAREGPAHRRGNQTTGHAA